MTRALAAASLCGLALSSCSAASTPFATDPSSRPAALRRAAAGSANAVIAWALGASDYCPDKAEKIAIDVLAENASYNVISGSFSQPIALKDSDTSKATSLSKTTLTGAGAVTLSYSGAKIAPFQITGTTGGTTATLTIAPFAACVNASPNILVVRDGATGSTLSLSPKNASPPYDLGSSSTGSTRSCGIYVQLRETATNAFDVISELLGWGTACSVYATAIAENVVTAHPVLIVK